MSYKPTIKQFFHLFISVAVLVVFTKNALEKQLSESYLLLSFRPAILLLVAFSRNQEEEDRRRVEERWASHSDRATPAKSRYLLACPVLLRLSPVNIYETAECLGSTLEVVGSASHGIANSDKPREERRGGPADRGPSAKQQERLLKDSLQNPWTPGSS
ncbi:hypothetical protein NDU88_005215 [Pleurodeles waltl]|uniref:Uncharacterized protein n=1 Tax=Pleurodeles waltl TaxID=8319 RepID=A0AAV7MVR0_PLEWA|nr:hypothetical protein NDU88_005215 [Pleurodeles waltl]